jgi:hypothetical protein
MSENLIDVGVGVGSIGHGTQGLTPTVDTLWRQLSHTVTLLSSVMGDLSRKGSLDTNDDGDRYPVTMLADGETENENARHTHTTNKTAQSK